MRSTGLALLLLLLPPAAFAQVAATGNVYGTVTDESGAVLPGATATLAGDFGSRTTTSGSGGEFRFLNVDHGSHKLTVALTGFTTVTRNVTVAAGTSVNVAFNLKVASVEETITVSSETPVVDTKKTGTSTTLSTLGAVDVQDGSGARLTRSCETSAGGLTSLAPPWAPVTWKSEARLMRSRMVTASYGAR